MKKIHTHMQEYVSLKDFPKYYQGFLTDESAKGDARALCIESAWERIVAKNGNDAKTDVVMPFVEWVFEWGGKARHRIPFLSRYSKKEVAKFVREASLFLQDGDLKSAIDTMTPDGLGIAFGSKILRMMSPQQAVVYNEMLKNFFRKEGFSYPWTSKGYAAFAGDCGELSAALWEMSIKHPYRKNGEWYAADVESALFYGLQCREHIGGKK